MKKNINLTNREIEILSQVLNILKTCKVNTKLGIGYYTMPYSGATYSFLGLCSLIRLCSSIEVTKSLVEKLNNFRRSHYPGKVKLHRGFWFSTTGEEFIKERVDFLEYILKTQEQQ